MAKVALRGSPSKFIDRTVLDRTVYRILNANDADLEAVDGFIKDQFSTKLSLPRGAINLEHMRDCSLFLALAERMNIAITGDENNGVTTNIREKMKAVLAHEKYTKLLKDLPETLYDCINADFIMAGHPAAIRQTAMLMIDGCHNSSLPYAANIEVIAEIDGVVEPAKVYRLTPTADEMSKGVLTRKFSTEIKDLTTFKAQTKQRIFDLAQKYKVGIISRYPNDVDLFDLCKDGRVLIEIYCLSHNCFIQGYHREPGRSALDPIEEINYYWRVLGTLCTKERVKDALDYDLDLNNDKPGELLLENEIALYKVVYFVLYVVESRK